MNDFDWWNSASDADRMTAFFKQQAAFAKAKELLRDASPHYKLLGCGWDTWLNERDALLAEHPEIEDPVIHAMHEETGRGWMGLRSRIPPGFGEVCTDAEYAAQIAAEMKHD